MSKVFVQRPGLTFTLVLCALAWLWAGPPTFNSSARVLLRRVVARPGSASER